MSSIDNKKIAKNTLMLYIRMLLIMAITIYTTRVLLKVLGVEDYGIYNIVSTFVTFLAFITNALTSAMQRYFNVALGENDTEKYNKVFSISINILLIFSTAIFIIGETVGLWFLNTQLNIPEGKVYSAFWVYQLSLLTFVVNTLRTPYNASVIAHEKMAFYAYLSLFEVAMRLGTVFALLLIPFDKLIFYALLYLLLNALVNFIYVGYCSRRFKGCRYHFYKDKAVFKELLGFSGWTLLGQSAVIIHNQGVMIIVNRMFSVVANTAMAIANQVTAAVDLFVSNFQTAFKPQLIQTYSAGNLDSHYKLIFRASRFSFYLITILLVPLIQNIDYILTLWLGEYPKHTKEFVIYILLSHLISALSSPLITSIFATGRIKNYQIYFATSYIATIFAIYLCFVKGAPPYYAAIVAIFLQVILWIIRLYYVCITTRMPCVEYIKKVAVQCLLVSTFAYLPIFLCNESQTFLNFILSSIVMVAYSGFIIMLLGLNKNERNFIINKIKRKC